MKNRAFLDTNILVYAIDENSILYQESREFIFSSGYHLYTSSKNISEFLVVTTKGANGLLSLKDALRFIDALKSFVEVYYPTEQSTGRFTELLERYEPKGMKIHDFEIISIALANEINQIVTINKKDFRSVQEINLIDLRE